MPVSPGRKAGHRVQLTCEHTAEEVCRGPDHSGRHRRRQGGADQDWALRARGVRLSVPYHSRHRLIKDEALFYGTINNRAGVYTRVLLQKALEYNAAAVILFHNHPSGTAEQAIAIRV